jgi:hypothetical protein
VAESRDNKWQERASEIDRMDRYELRNLVRDLLDENHFLLTNYATVISGASEETIWN